ncbi:PTS sorbitol transporter subunit IIC [Anaerosalibacter bizertensis]|mgnify:FL=1|uniref:PTS glucitol/sorbitol transporter subunit IIC n=1 Tax=Anaerosalibacter bizertensis TaxID=932217 RepID=A0A844FEL9_9FIRM|nr:PTS glucitol/sorbitol transporter subunit IIC [Anaerosalibacter bizertensis]MBV1817748.1 PTS glucitol/sorbitol transporter subunit IIC [Bacteroidales bacterium MSK.15.36]HHV25863.1 PTS sorbitol transporter subunit IIC [Tissierellia bacterium]MBU5293671.1 PTS glucitol/sorbitol transporter subunit IIC [Anaerosalibacter bizertensis]MCB5559317.1 PTS glucitol/sorbitol transporter subunit IIC [Anaerosalibacter bizertensis]MCG4565673.1 PTS glucitol/sorbitol transporter subunit IIC [Anaerosalibacte
MEVLANLAEGFIGLFEEGGKTFVDLMTGILPTLIVLITFVNAIVKIVGEERVQKVAEKATQNAITRYTILPLISVFFLTNPMCYTFGKFLDEKYKPAFYDAAVSFVHPITGLFPHANPAELFVYLGIAEGIKELGLSLGQLAVRYFIVGLIVIFIRGLVTEFITMKMLKKKQG